MLTLETLAQRFRGPVKRDAKRLHVFCPIHARAELRTLEDAAAAAEWVWDEPLSHQIDRLFLVLEADRR